MTARPLHFRASVFTATLAAALLVAGCSDRRAGPAVNATTENTAPAIDEDTASRDVVEASLMAGRVAATYRAAFEEGQLKRIAEERKPEGVAARRADYVFHGARLMEYSGAALQSDGTVELRFDMQGALLSSSGSDGKPDDAEVSAIRNRAQLLRSHALARRSTRAHGA